jgi:hypothetical protein
MISEILLDGKMVCFTSAATIRQILEILLIWATNALSNRYGKEYERQEKRS